MKRIAVRPRIQIPVLIAVFSVVTFLGFSYFTAGDVVAKHQWFGVTMGCVCLVAGPIGIWRAARMGVVIDADGIRVRGFDSRDQVVPWTAVEAIECGPVDERAGLTIHAPVLRLVQASGDVSVMPLVLLGSYSPRGAERRRQQLDDIRRSGADV
ncbi:hypothetical protein [Actinoplanes sp. NPDC051851]|uniref:hypothetical protein n=1 Tax=Actinoplanes sp. NPDC051851 TaxID=3154753 RepID=UPI00342385BB